MKQHDTNIVSLPSGVWNTPLTRRLVVALGLWLSLPAGVLSAEQFAPNRVFARKEKLVRSAAAFETAAARQRMGDIARLLEEYFGTPDDPRVPQQAADNLDVSFDLGLLRQAAGPPSGPAGEEARGLYRQWCARCHGVSGDGRGPDARHLDPYPRDFRRGIFKFKRTPSTLPPTRDDLHAVLLRGVPGTAMPSFGELPESHRQVLVEYVRYLSIRGLAERAIISEVAFELDEGERLLDPPMRDRDPAGYQAQLAWMTDIVEDVIRPWQMEPQLVTVPDPPRNFGSAKSVARGRELFFTTLSNCATCHGNTALGDGQTDDYDEWMKELDPDHPEQTREYLSLGALPLRRTVPRDLRQGVYRGGERREDVFLRIKHGIAGTTMPSVAVQLTDDDVWHLVAYSRFLPEDPLLDAPAMPDTGRASIGLPLATRLSVPVALAGSAVTLFVALWSARVGRRRSAVIGVLATLALGALAIGLRVDEYRRLASIGIPFWNREGALHARADLYYLHAVRVRLTELFRRLETMRVQQPEEFSAEHQARWELVTQLRDHLVTWTEEEIGHWLDDVHQRQSLIEIVAFVVHPVEAQREAVREHVREERSALSKRGSQFQVVSDYCRSVQSLMQQRRAAERGTDGTASSSPAPITTEETAALAQKLVADLAALGITDWAVADSAIIDSAQPLLLAERLAQINTWLQRARARAAFLDTVVDEIVEDPQAMGLNRRHPWLRLPIAFPNAPDWACRYFVWTGASAGLLAIAWVLLAVTWWRRDSPVAGRWRGGLVAIWLAAVAAGIAVCFFV